MASNMSSGIKSHCSDVGKGLSLSMALSLERSSGSSTTGNKQQLKTLNLTFQRWTGDFYGQSSA